MSKKTQSDFNSFNSLDEAKEAGIRSNLSKFEHDLYHEEDDVVMPVIRIKNIKMPNKGEKWKVLEDTKTTMIIEGAKLSKKEREFLHTPEGVSFLMSQYKAGIKSFNSFKLELKKQISLT